MGQTSYILNMGQWLVLFITPNSFDSFWWNENTMDICWCFLKFYFHEQRRHVHLCKSVYFISHCHCSLCYSSESSRLLELLFWLLENCWEKQQWKKRCCMVGTSHGNPIIDVFKRFEYFHSYVNIVEKPGTGTHIFELLGLFAYLDVNTSELQQKDLLGNWNP